MDEPEIVRFSKLVRSMRAAQDRYFRGDHSPAMLATCKDLERRVDKAVRWVQTHRQQGELFPGREVGDGPYHRRRRGGKGDR